MIKFLLKYIVIEKDQTWRCPTRCAFAQPVAQIIELYSRQSCSLNSWPAFARFMAKFFGFSLIVKNTTISCDLLCSPNHREIVFCWHVIGDRIARAQGIPALGGGVFKHGFGTFVNFFRFGAT